jgi:hypothetical protein
MISRSPYFWSKSFRQVEHFFIITFFFLSSFVLYFFVFFSHRSICLDLLFVFFIIIALILHPIKKIICFPLLLHVLDRCFKIFKSLELNRGSSSFPNHFSYFSFWFSHVEFIFFSFLCNVIIYISIYNLEIFPVG